MTTSPPSHIDKLIEWLSIDSTTGQERTYLLALEAHLRSLGLNVVREPVSEDRWNIRAFVAPDPPLVFCTHTDTVPPFFGPEVSAGRIRARGACDTKGGLFAMLEAWRRMSELERRSIGFWFVVGEEVDHIGAKVAAKEGWPGARHIVLGEPTRGRTATGQKGILSIELTSKGVFGHSAFPEAGDSAIAHLLDAIGRIRAHDWPKDEALGETTLNVGVIEGGVAANVFAPEARALVLFRAVSDTHALEATIRKLVGDSAIVGVISRNEATRLVAIEGEPTTVVPFNTDAPYLNAIAPVTLVGPGDIRTAHSPREEITFDDLEEGIAQYRRIATRLLQSFT